ncbi:MAG: hypothetical protein M3083_05060 [Actinomycetota bacterium]|nr:hypothetical protein [Actinomycetota bacterium]
MGLVAVCADPDVASVLLARGAHVVLCRPEATRPGEAVSAPHGEPGGRVGLLIGDLADPEVEAAALGMAKELFGGEPVLIAAASEAGQFEPYLPGPSGAPSGSV